MFKIIADLKQITGEAKELKDRLINPLTGPLIPFCVKSFGRLSFCGQIVESLLLVSAGGAGAPELALTMLSNPVDTFAILTEAFIPTLDKMEAEGKSKFKINLNKVLMTVLKITTEDIKLMKVDEFITALKSIKQIGGYKDRRRIK